MILDFAVYKEELVEFLNLLLNPLGPRPAAALSLRNPMCTTLKINNKHETTAHFVFFPIGEYSVLVFPTGLDFFHSKIKATKK